jgi:hypothetical protein
MIDGSAYQQCMLTTQEILDGKVVLTTGVHKGVPIRWPPSVGEVCASCAPVGVCLGRIQPESAG